MTHLSRWLPLSSHFKRWTMGCTCATMYCWRRKKRRKTFQRKNRFGQITIKNILKFFCCDQSHANVQCSNPLSLCIANKRMWQLRQNQKPFIPHRVYKRRETGHCLPTWRRYIQVKTLQWSRARIPFRWTSMPSYPGLSLGPKDLLWKTKLLISCEDSRYKENLRTYAKNYKKQEQFSVI